LLPNDTLRPYPALTGDGFVDNPHLIGVDKKNLVQLRAVSNMNTRIGGELSTPKKGKVTQLGTGLEPGKQVAGAVGALQILDGKNVVISLTVSNGKITMRRVGQVEPVQTWPSRSDLTVDVEFDGKEVTMLANGTPATAEATNVKFVASMTNPSKAVATMSVHQPTIVRNADTSITNNSAQNVSSSQVLSR
jgi:chitinase